MGMAVIVGRGLGHHPENASIVGLAVGVTAIRVALEEAGGRRLGKAGATRGPLLSSSSIGRLGMGVGTVVINTRVGDSHCHWKLVDTEGGGSWLVVVVGPITLDEKIVQGDVGLTKIYQRSQLTHNRFGLILQSLPNMSRILKQMTGFRLLRLFRLLSWKFHPSNVVVLDVYVPYYLV